MQYEICIITFEKTNAFRVFDFKVLIVPLLKRFLKQSAFKRI